MIHSASKAFKMSIQAEKKELRRSILQRMKQIDSLERERQSLLVTKTLLSSPIYLKAKRISVYLSLPSELSTKMIVEDLLKEG